MKKVKLIEATQDRVYSDIYGWVNSAAFFVVCEVPGYYGTEHLKFSQHEVYVKTGGQYHTPTNADMMSVKGESLYRKDSRRYSGRLERDLVQISDPQITVSWQGITTKKELSKVEVYEIDTPTPYRVLKDHEIHKGVLVMFVAENAVSQEETPGTYVVTECFEQPNRENRLCVVEPLASFKGDQRQAVFINAESGRLYTVPYVKYEEQPRELDVFNHPLREPELQPLVKRESDGHQSSIKKANLFWQPIAEASAYTVSLYCYAPGQQLKHELYPLQRFEVERNVHWHTIENLIGNCRFIVMLEAEDRQGNVIARTRGIEVAYGKPQWW